MTNAQLERIFDELRRRGALRALQAFLGTVNVPSARSWTELQERVRQAIADKSLDPDLFVDFFVQVQLTAYKAYRLYGLEAKERKALINHFAQLKKSNDFAKNYPFPVSQSALRQADDDPVPVSIQDTTSGTALILCSPRRFFARTEIPSTHLDQSVRPQYRGARLFADEQGVFQAYDVIFVSKNDDYVQVRTDLGANRLEEDSNVLQASVTDVLMQLVIDAGLPDQPSPIDLFGAVRKIYQAKKEGRVSEMYFDCIKTVSVRLNNWLTSTQAELTALQLATSTLKYIGGGGGIIFCDSMSALQAIENFSWKIDSKNLILPINYK